MKTLFSLLLVATTLLLLTGNSKALPPRTGKVTTVTPPAPATQPVVSQA